jgi:hypothetical protein
VRRFSRISQTIKKLNRFQYDLFTGKFIKEFDTPELAASTEWLQSIHT